MAVIWQTLEEAALTLGVSSRTLHRRIAKGEFPTRMESGRREVQVTIADPPPPVRDGFSAASDTSANDRQSSPGASESRRSMSDHVRQVADGMQDTVLALHEDRIRRTDLAVLAYQQTVTTAAAEAQRAQRNGRVAWGVAGLSVIGLLLSVIWTTHSLTKARAEANHLNQTVRQLSDTADSAAKNAEKLRGQAEAARLAAATAQGQLDAANGQMSAVKTQLEQLSQAQQALQAKVQADSAQQAVATVPSSVAPPSAPATRPSATTQPFLYWSDTIIKPISP